MNVFKRFPQRLQQAIVSQLGWSELRLVQKLSSSAILDEKNVIIIAPTAGGKTEAAVFPMLAKLMMNEPEQVGLIYIAPLKALLNNQEERLQLYAEMVGLRAFKWHGDVTATQKNRFKKHPAEILMITPESLEVMLLSGRVSHPKLFHDLRACIVDEIHAIAGKDRGAHLKSVIERIQQVSKNDIQRIGLSATVGNPFEILKWLQGSSKRDSIVINPQTLPSKKDIKILSLNDINTISLEASQAALGKKSLLFCKSRALAEKIAESMKNRGTEVFVHHSSISKEERALAEEKFHKGSNACIVCTSTLELGIDIGDLDLVLQVNTPQTVSSFLQRMGRTGRRANQRANTTFYCEYPQEVLQAIALVELAKNKFVEAVSIDNRCWPVLVHQIFALTLQYGAVNKEVCWKTLSLVSDFSGITRNEFEYLIQYLLDKNFLCLTDGFLCMGEKAETIFGRRNFMELYSVFTTPSLYKVKTETNYIVGTLEQFFVDKLVENMSTFLLSGKAWIVKNVLHRERKIIVIPAPDGKKTTWGGFVPWLLSYELCRKMQEVLKSDEKLTYLDAESKKVLQEMKKSMKYLLYKPEPWIEYEQNRALWWTFAGGQINYTLKYAMELISNWKIVPDNVKLKIEGNNINRKSVEKILKIISKKDFWNKQSTQEIIMNSLPNYRLSKFQIALPAKYSAEMISKMLLDIQTIENNEKKAGVSIIQFVESML